MDSQLWGLPCMLQHSESGQQAGGLGQWVSSLNDWARRLQKVSLAHVHALLDLLQWLGVRLITYALVMKGSVKFEVQDVLADVLWSFQDMPWTALFEARSRVEALCLRLLTEHIQLDLGLNCRSEVYVLSVVTFSWLLCSVGNDYLAGRSSCS